MTDVLLLIEAGEIWPALSLALILATHGVRRGWLDPWLDRLRWRLAARVYRDAGERERTAFLVRWGLGHLRALVPVALAGAAWAIAVLCGADTLESARTAVLSAMGSLSLHAVGKAAGAGGRVVAAKPQRTDAVPRVTDPDE